MQTILDPLIAKWQNRKLNKRIVKDEKRFANLMTERGREKENCKWQKSDRKIDKKRRQK